jgi:hypothetical protein
LSALEHLRIEIHVPSNHGYVEVTWKLINASMMIQLDVVVILLAGEMLAIRS